MGDGGAQPVVNYTAPSTIAVSGNPGQSQAERIIEKRENTVAR